MPELLARLRVRLSETAGPAPLEAFLPGMPDGMAPTELLTRSAVSSTFLAILELSRMGEARVQQDDAFGPLLVERAAKLDRLRRLIGVLYAQGRADARGAG